MLKRIHSIGAHDRPAPVCHAMRSSDEAEVATDAEDSAAYEVEGAGRYTRAHLREKLLSAQLR